MKTIVAFDFDGTIAETIPMCIEAFRISISPYVNHELTTQEIVQTFGRNEIGMVKTFVKKNWEQALCDFYETYTLLHRNTTEPFPGIRELILWLKANQILIALITGKGKKSCSISLKALQMEHVFDEIRYGSEKSPNKAACMKSLMNQYSVSKNNFYYIGDTLQDICACREAGVTCLSAAWQDAPDIDILEKENKGLVFCSVDDLQHYLQKSGNFSTA